MAVKFKYMPSLKQNYERQGEIFFTCRNYQRLCDEERERIRALCAECAKGDSYKRQAIFAFMTTGATWRECCMKYHISDSTLERLRQEFYRLWDKLE